jgi:hypothetical protein
MFIHTLYEYAKSCNSSAGHENSRGYWGCRAETSGCESIKTNRIGEVLRL